MSGGDRSGRRNGSSNESGGQRTWAEGSWLPLEDCSWQSFEDQGGSCDIERWITKPPGEVKVEVCVDRGWSFDPDWPFTTESNPFYVGLIIESNERNNCEVTTIIVPGPAPDLAIDDAFLGLTPATAGEANAFLVQVTNHGTEAAPQALLEIDTGSSVLSATVPPLAVGDVEIVTVPWTPQVAGALTAIVEVDPNDEIPELEDATSNNRFEVEIQVEAPPEPLPDLGTHVSSLGIIPAAPQAGEAITGDVAILNFGPGDVPAGQDLLIQVELESVTQQTTWTSGLPAGESISLPGFITWLSASVGTHQMTVRIDPLDTVAEGEDHHANQRTLFFNVSDETSNVTCEGTWHLVGIGHPDSQSASGSVVDGCHVYWAQNEPDGATCWQTRNNSNDSAIWTTEGGCPVHVTATREDGAVFDYTVEIVP